MNVHDQPRFQAALARMCRLHGMAAPNQQTLADWGEVLQDYAIEAIEPALDQARQDAGRYQVKAAAVEAFARGLTRGGDAGKASGPTRFVPLSTDDDGRTLYQAEYACAACEDSGWEPVRYDATGQTRLAVMTMGDLRAAERVGRVHYRMRRCDCQLTRRSA